MRRNGGEELAETRRGFLLAAQTKRAKREEGKLVYLVFQAAIQLPPEIQGCSPRKVVALTPQANRFRHQQMQLLRR